MSESLNKINRLLDKITEVDGGLEDQQRAIASLEDDLSALSKRILAVDFDDPGNALTQLGNAVKSINKIAAVDWFGNQDLYHNLEAAGHSLTQAGENYRQLQKGPYQR